MFDVMWCLPCTMGLLVVSPAPSNCGFSFSAVTRQEFTKMWTKKGCTYGCDVEVIRRLLAALVRSWT